ncbi:unnamed protein product [Penicillium camemberti]|uniref:Str. FM013 n=1 Tax=Penicillium camemberti (strain FM 013) TaxID=1429867 RepID=A0A0G4P8K3_PENC3|nr:unnamed protein product [Penicillium camemberti]
MGMALGFNPVAVTGHPQPPPTFSPRRRFYSGACSGESTYTGWPTT